MRLDPFARAPQWALETGLAPPRPGERFRAYWSRVGFTAAEIELALAGLNAVSADVANDRMASAVRQRAPEAFRASLRKWAAAAPPMAPARNGRYT